MNLTVGSRYRLVDDSYAETLRSTYCDDGRTLYDNDARVLLLRDRYPVTTTGWN